MISLQKHFNVNEIKSNMIKTISDKELLNMHRRIHQLYNAPHPPDKKELEKKHSLIVKEMSRRKMSHKSALNEVM